MMSILVIFTGGTIGSSASGGWISPDKATNYLLIERYLAQKDLTPAGVHFDTLAPYTVLSENLSARELNLLISTVSANLDGGYDGIIVTHGTDTLQYSAAALSFAFPHATIPIVLVSSNYPLDDSRANGLANFSGAVDFIRLAQGGVFVSYRNDGYGEGNVPQDPDRVYIHDGARLLRHLETSDELSSLDGQPYARVEGGHVTLNPHYRRSQATGSTGQHDAIGYVMNPRILVITSHPGDGYVYDIDRYHAIIIHTYHSGTLDTANRSFTNFLETARSKGIPVFITGVHEGDRYASTEAYDRLGLTALPLCSGIAAYVKAWLAVSAIAASGAPSDASSDAPSGAALKPGCGAAIAAFMLEPLSSEFLG